MSSQPSSTYTSQSPMVDRQGLYPSVDAASPIIPSLSPRSKYHPMHPRHINSNPTSSRTPDPTPAPSQVHAPNPEYNSRQTYVPSSTLSGRIFSENSGNSGVEETFQEQQSDQISQQQSYKSQQSRWQLQRSTSPFQDSCHLPFPQQISQSGFQQQQQSSKEFEDDAGFLSTQQTTINEQNSQQQYHEQQQQSPKSKRTQSADNEFKAWLRSNELKKEENKNDNNNNLRNHKSNELIRISRQQMLIRFLAYDGCVQVCHEAQIQERDPSADVFLEEGCNQLRTAFKLDQLLLTPQNQSFNNNFNQLNSITVLWEEGIISGDKVGGFLKTKRILKIRCGGVYLGGAAKQVLNKQRQLTRKQSKNSNCCRDNDREAFQVQLRPQNVQNEGDCEIVSNAKITSNGDVSESEVLMVQPEQQNGEIKVEVRDSLGKIVARGSTCFSVCWQGALEIQGFVSLEKRRSKAPAHERRKNLELFSASKQRNPLRRLVPWQFKRKKSTSCNLRQSLKSIGEGHAWIQINCYATGQDKFCTVNLEVWVEDVEDSGIPKYPLNTSQVFVENSHTHQTTQISPYLIYDYILDAALYACQCGPRSLVMSPGWSWLLDRFANKFGVRDAYAVLAFLQWVVKPENSTCTQECLQVLSERLTLLLQFREQNLLQSMEKVMLENILKNTEFIVGRTFENYKGLSEHSPTGILEGGGFTAENPPVALTPAVELFKLIKDPLDPSDQFWLEERIMVAAKSTYQKLSCNCSENRLGLETDQTQNIPVYLSLATLIRDIRSEVERDYYLEYSEVFPQFLQLSKITAQVYVSLLNERLVNLFRVQPPTEPTESAVEMIMEMGRLERFINDQNLAKKGDDFYGAEFVALALFSQHFARWLQRLEDELISKTHQMEASMKVVSRSATEDDAGEYKFISPVIVDISEQLQQRVQYYELIITYWPQLGPALESSMCSVIRESILVVSRQCGMKRVRESQVRESTLKQLQQNGNNNNNNYNNNKNNNSANAPVYCPSSKAPLWEWCAPSQDGCTPSPYSLWVIEAVLLNSLRRLLEFIPIMEDVLRNWCGVQHQPITIPDPIPPCFETASPLGQPCKRKMETLSGNNNTNKRSMSPERAHVLGLRVEENMHGPHLGVHFAQLAMELRSEYSYAVIQSSRRLSRMISATSTCSISQITASQTDMVHNMAPFLQPFMNIVEQTLGVMKGVLEERVFIAMARGVWDFCAKDLLEYVDVLHQSKENREVWRWRQNAEKALLVVDSFFRNCITQFQMGNILERDLDYPIHAQELHNLLQSPSNISYHVV